MEKIPISIVNRFEVFNTSDLLVDNYNMSTTCTTTPSSPSIFKFENVKKALQPIFIPSAPLIQPEIEEETFKCKIKNDTLNELNFIHQKLLQKRNSIGLRSQQQHHYHHEREQQLFLEVDLNDDERCEILANQVSINNSNECRRQKQLIFHEKAIQQVRETIESKVRESPDKFYTEDVDKFMTDTWSVVRFFPEETATALTDSAIEKITQNVLTCLRWRKEVRIREITLKYFPQQFFQTGLFNFGVDVKTGKRVIYIRGKQHKKFSELTDQFIQFGSCLYEKIDNDLKGNKVTLFLDLSDVSLESADVAMFRHFLDLLFNYFPSALDQVFIYEASWYLRPVVYFILKVVPEKYAKLVRMIGKKDISSMEASSIPDVVGGTMKTTSLEVPEGAISLDQFVEQQGLPADTVEKAKKLYKLSWWLYIFFILSYNLSTSFLVSFIPSTASWMELKRKRTDYIYRVHVLREHPSLFL